jgi:Methyltransferase domain
MDTSLRGIEPGHWGSSLANVAELLLPVLDASRAQSVAEVGAHAGDLTQWLLDWARGAAGTDDEEARPRVLAIEPKPPPELIELERRYPELEVVAGTSHDALSQIPLPDAVIIDGDHNYYTVSGELEIVDRRASWTDGPLVILHDVCWPHARRDTYYEPDRIPPEDRPSTAHDVGIVPWEPEIEPGGLPFPWAARREGGARNGVLTAVEDFVAAREGLRLAIVPVFFGLGVLWHVEAPWAGAVADIVEPWDRNPILARLEANRVFHLAEKHMRGSELFSLRERIRIQEEVLRLLLNSRAFALGEWASRLRKGGEPAFSRELVKRALGDADRS